MHQETPPFGGEGSRDDAAAPDAIAAREPAARRARRIAARASARLRRGYRTLAAQPRAALPPRIADLFREEAARGRSSQFVGRKVALVGAFVLATAFEEFPGSLWFYAFIAAFYVAGWAHERADRRGEARPWLAYLFATLDMALLVTALTAPNPFAVTDYPPQMELRFDNIVYLFLLIIAPVYTYQPKLVLWNGAMAALFWMTAVLIMAALPSSTSQLPRDGAWAAPGSPVLSPTFVHWQGALHDCILILLIATLLAYGVARMRRLVWRYAELERERSNLARFLPPAMVDRLAAQDHALGAVRERRAAVMFADIIGFTAWAEARPPAEVIGTLREVLERLETLVFRHGGTLDKFTGDGLLATFGAFDEPTRPATDAIACVRAIMEDIEAWNASEARRGQEPIRLSVGLHFGPVVVGDIGSHRRLELTVLGDSVNVSSRLEALTRAIGRPAAVSQSVIDAVRAEQGGAGGAPAGEDPALGAEDRFGAALLAAFEPAGEHVLRGRRAPVQVWAYREAGATTDEKAARPNG